MSEKQPVEPNDGEKANGWTSESLTRYLEEMETQKMRYLMDMKAPKRVEIENVASFDARKW